MLTAQTPALLLAPRHKTASSPNWRGLGTTHFSTVTSKRSAAQIFQPCRRSASAGSRTAPSWRLVCRAWSWWATRAFQTAIRWCSFRPRRWKRSVGAVFRTVCNLLTSIAGLKWTGLVARGAVTARSAAESCKNVYPEGTFCGSWRKQSWYNWGCWITWSSSARTKLVGRNKHTLLMISLISCKRR